MLRWMASVLPKTYENYYFLMTIGNLSSLAPGLSPFKTWHLDAENLHKKTNYTIIIIIS